MLCFFVFFSSRLEFSGCTELNSQRGLLLLWIGYILNFSRQKRYRLRSKDASYFSCVSAFTLPRFFIVGIQLAVNVLLRTSFDALSYAEFFFDQDEVSLHSLPVGFLNILKPSCEITVIQNGDQNVRLAEHEIDKSWFLREVDGII